MIVSRRNKTAKKRTKYPFEHCFFVGGGIFLFLSLFSRIVFWTETGSFYRTIMKYPTLQQAEKNLAAFQASISMPISILWMNPKKSKIAIQILIR